MGDLIYVGALMETSVLKGGATWFGQFQDFSYLIQVCSKMSMHRSAHRPSGTAPGRILGWDQKEKAVASFLNHTKQWLR